MIASCFIDCDTLYRGMASQRDELVLGVFEQVAAHGYKAVVLDNSGPLLTAAQIFLKISALS